MHTAIVQLQTKTCSRELHERLSGCLCGLTFARSGCCANHVLSKDNLGLHRGVHLIQRAHLGQPPGCNHDLVCERIAHSRAAVAAVDADLHDAHVP